MAVKVAGDPRQPDFALSFLPFRFIALASGSPSAQIEPELQFTATKWQGGPEVVGDIRIRKGRQHENS